ncbi:MAG: hypothetical protein CVV27_07475 [Candidatus Melainabacteria bacterium HGW-Melainabacteria-1]|nr:MAG: hypothetical protein CVV27_07475 [Candidatus Melainabacteria bacterium HGW-Melainabacteria-1]
MQAQETPSIQESFLGNYVVMPEVFSPEECRRIVYINLPAAQAYVTRFEEGSFNDLQLHARNTKVKSIPQSTDYLWLYERVSDSVKLVNRQFYRFAIDALTDLQVLEYENTGFYGTHVDVGTGETSRRKLSMVVFLTPPQEYDGGELILKPWFTPVTPAQGSVVFFPSYIPHEITPVTRGVRHTLVTWMLGPCFQ